MSEYQYQPVSLADVAKAVASGTNFFKEAVNELGGGNSADDTLRGYVTLLKVINRDFSNGPKLQAMANKATTLFASHFIEPLRCQANEEAPLTTDRILQQGTSFLAACDGNSRDVETLGQIFWMGVTRHLQTVDGFERDRGHWNQIRPRDKLDFGQARYIPPSALALFPVGNC